MDDVASFWKHLCPLETFYLFWWIYADACKILALISSNEIFLRQRFMFLSLQYRLIMPLAASLSAPGILFYSLSLSVLVFVALYWGDNLRNDIWNYFMFGVHVEWDNWDFFFRQVRKLLPSSSVMHIMDGFCILKFHISFHHTMSV